MTPTGLAFGSGVAQVLERAGSGAVSATAALTWLVAHDDPCDTPRITSLRALANLGPAAATSVPTLLSVVDHPSWSVRYDVWVTLLAIAPRAPQVQRAARRALADPVKEVRFAAQAVIDAGR